MGGLLQVANPHEGDGSWMAGLETEAIQSGLSTTIADVCLPNTAYNLAGRPGGAPGSYRIVPFGIIVRLRESTLCRFTDPAAAVEDAIRTESEKAAGHAMWFGTGSSEMWLGADRVTSVTPGDDPIQTAGRLLDAFHSGSVGVAPVLHLGVASAARLGSFITAASELMGVNVPVVVSPGYPADGMAITGPVEVWLSDVQEIEGHAWRINRGDFEATRVAAISFDPAAAFIAGEPPLQAYIASTGPLAVRLFLKGNETAATVDWGDGSADDTYAPDTDSVDHTYAEAGRYTITATHNGADRVVNTTV